MNILFITTYTGIGGGESLQLNLMGALDRARYRLHLLTPRDGPFPQAAAKLGVTTHVLPFRGATTLFIPRLWALFPITARLCAFLQAHAISAVMSDYHALPFILPAAESQRLHVLWNAMGWWFPIRPWQRRFFLRPALRILAITNAVKEGLLGNPPRLSPDRIEVVIPGVDTRQFKPGIDGSPVRARLGIGPDVPLVAMVGRFQAAKGHEVFQKAVRSIAQAVPEARFVVSGDNTGTFKVAKDEAYKQAILRDAGRDPILRERLTYLGFYPDVREVIAASDVMVCSSNFESLSFVAMESMALERPIVSTRVGGPSETILDGVTGYLVPPRDAEAIADRVVALLRNPALRRKMGVAGRDHVLRNLSIERYAAAISAIFEDMRIDKIVAGAF